MSNIFAKTSNTLTESYSTMRSKTVKDNTKSEKH